MVRSNTSILNVRFTQLATSGMGRLHSMASGSFRDAKLERPVSGAELRRLLVASRPSAAIELWGKQSLNFVLGTTKGHRRKAGWRFGSAARLRRKPGLQAALCYAIDLA